MFFKLAFRKKESMVQERSLHPIPEELWEGVRQEKREESGKGRAERGPKASFTRN